MESTKKDGYGRKCRGILFSLKTSLTVNKMSLTELVFKVFTYEKERFTKAEFTELIRSVDERLSFEDIDHLIESLDPDGNGFVFFTTLRNALSSIT